jgi:hypothetical protein
MRCLAAGPVALALGSSVIVRAQEPRPSVESGMPASPNSRVEPTKPPERAQSKGLSHRFQLGLGVRAGTADGVPGRF